MMDTETRAKPVVVVPDEAGNDRPIYVLIAAMLQRPSTGFDTAGDKRARLMARAVIDMHTDEAAA